MDKIHYSIYSEQIECTHSYSWKPHKNDTVDVSSSAYHSMSKWANQCKRSFQGNENEADDRSGSGHCLKCGWNIPVEYSWPNRCGIPTVPIATGSVKPMSKSATAKLISKNEVRFSLSRWDQKMYTVKVLAVRMRSDSNAAILNITIAVVLAISVNHCTRYNSIFR